MNVVRTMAPLAATENHHEAEQRAWEALPFVNLLDGRICSNWSPASSDDYFVSRQCGVHYAYMVVQHLRWHHTHQDVDATRRLSDLFASMCRRDRWTGTELAFSQSLGTYLAAIRDAERTALECS